jgi:hypothetical protein
MEQHQIQLSDPPHTDPREVVSGHEPNVRECRPEQSDYTANSVPPPC